MKLTTLGNAGGVLTLDRILSAEQEAEMTSKLETFPPGTGTLAINFSPLDYLTSGGASLLIKAAVWSKARRIKLLALGLGARYREIFSLTGLDAGYTIVTEPKELFGYFLGISADQIDALWQTTGRQLDTGWSPAYFRLRMREKPPEAMGLNVDKRRVIGPLAGFGPMWEKTYFVKLVSPTLQVYDVIDIMKAHFPHFQPPENTFYPTSEGIKPGEIVLIDSRTPGGVVSTGVLVLYADDLSFTLMTPQGHPEAGWVTFSATQLHDGVYMQIQGLARAADPFYEMAFRIAGSKFQETIWTHVLISLVKHLKLEAEVNMRKDCLANNYQWGHTGNFWYNAQIRSLPHNIPRLFKSKKPVT